MCVSNSRVWDWVFQYSFRLYMYYSCIVSYTRAPKKQSARLRLRRPGITRSEKGQGKWRTCEISIVHTEAPTPRNSCTRERCSLVTDAAVFNHDALILREFHLFRRERVVTSEAGFFAPTTSPQKKVSHHSARRASQRQWARAGVRADPRRPSTPG